MNRTEAIAKAQRFAQKFNRTWHVVFEDPGEGYLVVDDSDLDTEFAGEKPLATVKPNGDVTTA